MRQTRKTFLELVCFEFLLSGIREILADSSGRTFRSRVLLSMFFATCVYVFIRPIAFELCSLAKASGLGDFLFLIKPLEMSSQGKKNFYQNHRLKKMASDAF